MDKPVATVWRDFFANWPTSFARKGVAIATCAEQIPFTDFLISDDVVILERPTPDAVGGRRVVLPFGRIEIVKYVEPLKTQQLTAAGFRAAAGGSTTTPPKEPAPA